MSLHRTLIRAARSPVVAVIVLGFVVLCMFLATNLRRSPSGRRLIAVRSGERAAASLGINVAGAIRLARQLGPGKTIVTMLCDSGTRYQSKLFNPAFLREKKLPIPPWLS